MAVFICHDSNQKPALASDSEIPWLWSNSTQSQLPKHVPAYVWLLETATVVYLWGSNSWARLWFTRQWFNCLPEIDDIVECWTIVISQGVKGKKSSRNGRIQKWNELQERVLDFLCVSLYTYNRNTFDLQVQVEETTIKGHQRTSIIVLYFAGFKNFVFKHWSSWIAGSI